MANKTIPQLPEQTGKTDNDLLAIVDSGETTTSKIKISTLLDGVGGKFIDAGGLNNIVPDYYATTAISDDVDNCFIAGGTGNEIGSIGGAAYDNNVIIGGLNNSLPRGKEMTIIGGDSNRLYAGGSNATDSVVIGGNGSDDDGWKSASIASTTGRNDGRLNSVMLGGVSNIITNAADKSATIGGTTNTMTGDNSVAAGGTSNTVSGSNNAIIGGTDGTNSSTRSVMIGGRQNNMGSESGEASIIAGGRVNTLTTNTYGRYNGIYSSYGSTIRNGGGASFYNSQLLILGGDNNVIEHTGTYPNMTTVGGNNNTLEDSTRGVIVGGNNTTLSGHINSVMIGCSGRTSGSDYYTYVESLEAFTHIVLNDYSNLNFASDSAAATGGVPLGGLYHNSGDLKVRIT